MKNDWKAQVSHVFSKYAIYFILLGMIIIMSILKPENFPTLQNLKNILRQMTTIGIMGIGITFAIITGGIDISGGSVVAACSVVAAYFAKVGDNGQSRLPLFLIFVVAIAMGGILGFINGVITGYGKVPPFIVTLGMLSAARGVAMLLSNGRPIGNLSAEFNYIGGGELFGDILPIPILLFALCGVIGYILLQRTRFGTYVYAIGGNVNAALVSGINVKRTTTMVYTLAGLFNGLAAIIITARQNAGQPAVGQSYEMEAIACAVIGGVSLTGGIGTILGTIIGAIIMGILTSSMTMLQIDPNWQMVVKGAIIVVAVLIDMRKKRKEN